MIRRGAREQPSDEPDLFEAPLDDVFDRFVLERDRDGALWRAFATLSKRCQELLRLLVADEEPSYEEIGAALKMPIGSIGPTRSRCLDKLRSTVDLTTLEI